MARGTLNGLCFTQMNTMKTLKSFLTLTSLVGFAALAVQSSSGQVAVGIGPVGPPPSSVAPPSNISISTNIIGSSNVLWDVTLLTNQLRNLRLNLPTQGGSTVDISWEAPFTQNGRGKLAGSGTNATVSVVTDNGSSSNVFTGKYTSSGSITSAKGVAHVTFNARVSGSMLFDGDTKPRAVTAGGVYTAKLDANNDVVSGHYTEHATAAGRGSASKSKTLDAETVSALMAELGDGTWTLDIEFGTADGNKLTGSASVTLSSGQVYPFNLSGVYNPKTGQSKLNLKGYNAAAGSSLQVTLAGTSLSKATGQVSGQSVNIK